MPAALLKVLALLAALIVVSGCASSVEARPPAAERSAIASGQGAAVADTKFSATASDAMPAAAGASGAAGAGTSGGNLGAELVIRSLALLGVQYRLGGNSPETGLDCSGLVRHVFREALGLVLPRRSEEISRTGQAIAANELKPGDLVFFNTVRRAFSHVGIYIGNNQFVHAPSRGGQVRVENIDKQYWQTRFNGGRRLASDEGAAAVSMPMGADALPAGQASWVN